MNYYSLRQSGVALLDILIAAGILAIIAAAALPRLELENDKMVGLAHANQVARIERASMRFYRANDAWPANVGALTAGGFLDAGEDVDAWGNQFVLAVVGDDLSVSSDLQEERFVANARGHVSRPQVVGTTLTSVIDPPGEEAAHDALYARDGSRPLTGTMDADGNNISDVGVLGATTIGASGTISGGRVTASTDMRAPHYYDSNNTSFYGNFASRSRLNTMDIASIRDLNNTSYTWDGSGTTTQNNTLTNTLRIQTNSTEGGSCTTGSFGRTSIGEGLFCVSGVWQKAGGDTLSRSSFYNYSTSSSSTFTRSIGSHFYCSVSGFMNPDDNGRCQLSVNNNSLEEPSWSVTYRGGGGDTVVCNVVCLDK